MATFINQGAFQRIPLAMGVEAEIQLEPLRGTTVIPGRGSHTQTICATGSVYGLVIDARGRPLRLPESDEQRMSMIHKWVGVITG
jgi:hypothetical protein